MSIVEIPIDEIIAEQDFMMREKIDKKLVEEYAENIEHILSVAPLDVWDTPNGKYLSDGFHRFGAARYKGIDTVSCILRIGSVIDAHAHACIANLKHGKPLSREEKQKAIRSYLKINWDKSDRWLSEDLSIMRDTVSKYRRILVIEEGFELPEKVLGKDGGLYPYSGGIIMPPESNEFENDIEITYEQFLDERKTELENEWQNNFSERVLFKNAFDILPTITKKFDLIIVDPPYGITTEEWDLTTKYDLLRFTRKWLTDVLSLLKSTGRIFINWSREYMFDLKPLFDEINDYYPINFGGILVWHWRNSGSQPDNRKRYKMAWEPIFYYYGLEAKDLNWTETDVSGKSWKGRGHEQWDVWEFSIPQSNFKEDERIHPTQKPRALYEHIIKTASLAGDIILDPFAGSGTTGHACILTGRDYLLIEQKPEYYEKIKERLKKVWVESDDYKEKIAKIKEDWEDQINE